MRSLSIGDWAVVMLPTDNKKLLVQYQGSYEVIETVGRTDYEIRVGQKLRLFHVNTLKKYAIREGAVTSIAHHSTQETVVS